ncbi:MAG: AmmeMemoRadiSam system radical SAM enzyme [Actinomycetia bacterium]|nr:AmmeMemoRadiSam system radical SAM enzyme [Actinomycetes bacterium]
MSDGDDGAGSNAVSGAGGVSGGVSASNSGGATENRVGKPCAICPICPHACRLQDGQAGFCRARLAKDGRVQPLAFGRVTALALDPIEKKPLAHFLPGSAILSVGGFGCNLRCPFCQNADISQWGASAGSESLTLEVASGSKAAQKAMAKAANLRQLLPEDLVAEAVRLRPRGNVGIAYTYNEPLIAYEYFQQSAHLAHQAGLANVVVSNGYLSQEPLRELLGLIDAANIDLKVFSQSAYTLLGAPQGLERVKENIELLSAHCHLEVTTLIVPGLNNDEEQIAAIAAWLASIRRDIPLHITRFHPAFQMTSTPPPLRQDIYRYVKIASMWLEHVQAGNV